MLANTVPEIILTSQWRPLTLAAVFWDLFGIDCTRVTIVTLGRYRSIIERRLVQAFEAKHPDDAAREQKLAFYKKNFADQRQGSGRPHGNCFPSSFQIDMQGNIQ